jgi:hypothetical protein
MRRCIAKWLLFLSSAHARAFGIGSFDVGVRASDGVVSELVGRGFT